MLKILLKRRRYFLNFFLYMNMQIFLLLFSYIFLYKRHGHLLCWIYKKKYYFLTFHSSISYSKKFISILHVKWTGMNKREQVENLKFWVNILFEWPQRLFATTKIYILIFNLTHSLIRLKALKQPSQKNWPKILTPYFFTVTFT